MPSQAAAPQALERAQDVQQRDRVGAAGHGGDDQRTVAPQLAHGRRIRPTRAGRSGIGWKAAGGPAGWG